MTHQRASGRLLRRRGEFAYALWLLLALLLVSGCGGGDEKTAGTPKGGAPRTQAAVDPDYQQAVKGVDDRLDSAMSALFGDQQMTDPEIATARQALAQGRKDLGAVKPPAGVREAHQLYVAGLEEFGPVVDGLARAQGDPDKIRQHLTDPAYSSAIGKLERSKSAFNENGYEL